MPGTGEYEWQGFRKDLPRELNPPRGFIATANNNIQPKGYSPPLMFKTAGTQFERITRLLQIDPARRKKYTLEDHARLQHDALSLRAAADLPLFSGWTATEPRRRARARRGRRVGRASTRATAAAAAIYEAWRTGGGRVAADAAARGRPLKRRQPTRAGRGKTQGARSRG